MAESSESTAGLNDARREIASLLDAIPGLAAILTPDGEVDAVNNELIAYCGQPLEAMKQWGHNGTVHAEDLPRVATVFMHAISMGKPYDFDARIRRFDGVYRWNQVRGLPFRDPDGRIARWYVLLSDIDATKRAEEALRLSEERYALAVAGSDDGVWDIDFVAKSVFVSKRARELAGMPAGPEVTSLEEWSAMLPIHPEDAPRREAAMRAHLTDRAAAYEGEFRLRQPDGIYRWRRLHGLCLREANGEPRRMAGSISDVDARRRAEDALRLSEERYALALEASEEGHYDIDLQTGEIFVSARVNEIYGLPPQATTMDRAEFFKQVPFHPDDRPRIVAEVSKPDWNDRNLQEIQCRIVPRPGEVRWTRSRAKVVRDAQGRPRRRVGVLADITERKLAEQALREQTERLQLGQAAMRMIIMDWNVDKDLVTWSDSPEWLRGPMPPSGSYPPFKDQVHADDRDRFLATRRRALETLQIETTEFRLVRTDGKVVWVLERKHAFADADGKAVRMLSAMFDITDRKRVEDALRESDERYERVMLAADAGFWDWNVPADEFYASPKLLEMTSWPPGSRLAGRDDFLTHAPFHPDDRAKWEHAVTELFASGGTHLAMEMRSFHGTETRWALLSGMCVRDAAGKIVRWTGSATDITGRKKATDELRESEARFRALATVSSEAFWQQDENLRYIASPADVGGAGWPTANRVGKTRWEMDGNPTPLSGSWLEHQAVLAARQPFRDFEYRRFRPDGELGYYSASGVPIFDGGGNFKGYYGVAKDITERKRAERELRSRQEMLELAQKAARAAAFEWRVGAGERENRWSPDLEAMHGIPAGSYDGTYESWRKRVHPEDRPIVDVAIEAAQQTGDVDVEYRVLHPGGAVRWLQAKGRMLFDSELKPTQVVGFVFDVTDRHAAEEELQRIEQQLRQAQRLEALGTLAGGIAHDFNNLLGAILGYGEMALRNVRAGSRLRRDIENIMIAGERGHALVERILAFSRSGIGEQVPVHVEKVARETLELFAAKLPRHIVVERTLHAADAAVMGDPTQIHQVLMNLLSNAAQAMPSGGTLRVSLERARLAAPRGVTTGSLAAREYVVMEVADSGSGIPAQILERIFDPFFTTKEVGVGTGLGLSLVHGIVSALGGAVDVATTVGKGSTFKVYLPLARDVVVTSEPRKRLPRKHVRMANGRIMVVDDEEALLTLVTETLTKLGYSTVGFASGAKALEAFLADPEHFDAVITDESMPGTSGSELIHRMRELRPTLPVLLVSGYLGPAVIERARAAGATEFLRKPLSARQLQAALERALATTRRSKVDSSEAIGTAAKPP